MADLPDGIRVVIPVISRYSSITKNIFDNVGASQTDIYTRFAPTGYVSKLISITCLIHPPIGASSGDHHLFLKVGDIQILEVIATFNKEILIKSNIVVSDTLKTVPFEQSAQIANIQSIGFSKDVGFNMEYFNNTNATQMRVRHYNFLIQDIGVV